MANELLSLAARRELTRLDHKHYLELHSRRSRHDLDRRGRRANLWAHWVKVLDQWKNANPIGSASPTQ